MEDPSKDMVSGLILGDTDFVDWVKRAFLNQMPENAEMPQLKKLRSRYSIEMIVDLVADVFFSTRGSILEKGRKQNIARDVALYFSKDCSGEKGTTVAQLFGLRSGSAVTMRYNFICKKIENDKKLKRKIGKIKKAIMKI